MFRSSPPEVFSKKDTPQTRSKPTGEQPRRSAISTKLLCNFTEITPTHGCSPENPQHTRRALFLYDLYVVLYVYAYVCLYIYIPHTYIFLLIYKIAQ